MSVTLFATFVPASASTWGPYPVMFTLVYVCSTLYSWCWDVFMDWNVIDWKEPGLLRPRRMIQQTWTYYFAIGADLVLRFFWSWTLIPEGDDSNKALVGEFIAPFAAIAEIFRRTMWSVFRLENEHVHNTAGYRKTAHIPLHFDAPVPAHEPAEKEEDKQRRQVLLEIFVFVVAVVAVAITAIGLGT